MNSVLTYFAGPVFRTLNTLVPKRETQICIHSFPDYEDMTRGLLEGFSKSAPEFQIIILTHGVKNPPKWAEEKRGHVQHYRKFSVRGIWAYFRSKYVFFTLGCFFSIRPVKKQISVNVWHGMPIKTIGRYLGASQKIPYSTYVISTSPFFSQIISSAFCVPKERVLEVGLPRNDILLKEQNMFLRKQICGDQKFVIWLPTYRQSVVGDNRLDGELTNNIFNLPELDIAELDCAFKEMGVKVIVKPHPLAARRRAEDKLEDLSAIIPIDEAWLTNHGTTLYELLSISDMLITDISSVLVDYLVLDRPIVCHFPDVHAYKKRRGLIWDFDPTAYGIPLVARQQELVNAVRTELNHVGKRNLYPAFHDLMHTNHSNNCDRLIAALGMETSSCADVNAS